MKKTLAISVIIFLTLVSLTPVVSGDTNWEENKSWTYKWTQDFEENEEVIKDGMEKTFSNMFDSDCTVEFNELNGGFVYLFSIEFQEEKEGQYIFTYEGGYYSEMKMDTDINIIGGDDGLLQGSNMTIHNNIDIEEMNIDFEGKLWAKQYSQSFSKPFGGRKEMNTMGLTKQTLNTSGTVDISAQQTTYSKNYNSETKNKVQTDIDNQWELNLTLNYGKFLPWLPHLTKSYDNMPDDKGVGVKYSGNISYNLSSDVGSYSNNPKQVKNKELSGMESIEATLIPKSDNKISKPSPVKNSPWLGEKILYVKSQGSNYLDMSYALSSTIETKSLAKYDETEQFYTEFYLPQTGSMQQISCTSGACTLPSSTGNNISENGITSESTNKDELNSFRTDEKSYFDENVESVEAEGSSTENVFQEYVYIVVPVFIAIVLILALYIRLRSSRKGSRKTKSREDNLEKR